MCQSQPSVLTRPSLHSEGGCRYCQRPLPRLLLAQLSSRKMVFASGLGRFMNWDEEAESRLSSFHRWVRLCYLNTLFYLEDPQGRSRVRRQHGWCMAVPVCTHLPKPLASWVWQVRGPPRDKVSASGTSLLLHPDHLFGNVRPLWESNLDKANLTGARLRTLASATVGYTSVLLERCVQMLGQWSLFLQSCSRRQTFGAEAGNRW